MEEAYYRLLNDILNGYDRATPSRIVKLRNNQIFVFGTDVQGSQRHGAAGIAATNFGAKVGVTDGPTGNCYALPTKGFSFDDLAQSVEKFEQYVRNNFRYTYLVTAVGCGHAGFDVKDVARLFVGLVGLRNVMLPETFLKVYRTQCKAYFSKLSKVEDKCNLGEQNSVDEILEYYDDSVHEVVRFLYANNVEFNHEGGFSISDPDGNIIAEAELGIESEKIVFAPFDSTSSATFKEKGYSILTPEEYLKSKSL